MAQIEGGETFTNTSPGNQVDYNRLNNHVDNATLLNGAVIDQADVSTRVANTTPVAADTLLLGDSTNPDTAVPLKVQVQYLLLQKQRDGTQRWGGVAGGTANALTVTTSPASTGAYVSGEIIRFKTGGAANTGAVTINLDARGVANLYSTAVQALVPGDLPANAVVTAIYDGTQFQAVTVLAPKQVTSWAAAEGLRGGCQQYDVAGGTANAITIAPKDNQGNASFTAVQNGMVVRFKATAANTGAVTLAVNGTAALNLVGPTGAALGAGVIQSGQVVEAVYDSASNNWIVLSQMSATWSYISALTASPAASGVVQFAHGFGVIPTKIRVVLVQTNATAQNGYAQNDEVAIEALSDNQPRAVFAVVADATNITVIRTNSANCYQYPKGGGAVIDQSTALNTPNFYWKLKVYAAL